MSGRGRGGHSRGRQGGGRGSGRDGGGRGSGGPGGRRGGGNGGGRGQNKRETEQEGVAATQRALQGLQLTVARQEKLPNDLAKRPTFGTAGRRIKLFANHFALTCNSEKALHYDVDIQLLVKKGLDAETAKKPVLRRSTCRKAIQKLANQENWQPGWAFDGKKNLYAPAEVLPKQPSVFQVQFSEEEGDRPCEYEIFIQFAAEVKLREIQEYLQHGAIDYPQDVVQALEVALRHSASMRPDVSPARSALYFYSRDEVFPLGEGAEAWLGYHQSVRPCQMGFTVNIDTATAAFLPSCNVLDFLIKVAGFRSPNEVRQWDNRARAAIKNVRVRTTYHPQYKRKRTVVGLTVESASEAMFEGVDGEKISVAEHWKRKYKPLKYPDFPCLDVSSKDQTMYIPPECCEIIRGQRKPKLTEMQTSKMIRCAAQYPRDRQDFIQVMLANKAQFNRDPTLKGFGLGVTQSMAQVDARILPQPHLEYRDPKSLDVGTGGSWSLDRVSLYDPCEIKSWVFLNLASRRLVDVQGQEGIQGLAADVVSALRKLGMKVPDELPVHHGDSRRDVLSCMQEACRQAFSKYQKNPDIIFVMLERKDGSTYKDVKRASDCQLGIPSQCVLYNNALKKQLDRKRPQYCANIALKVNTKVGGNNCKIVGRPQLHFPVIGNDRFIIFGADVTHPATRQTTEPSVAGVVASVDPYATKYAARFVVQPSKEEIIDIKDVAQELLMEYRQAMNCIPEKIIFYRDGVSEGQFSQVLENECKQLREAYSTVAGPNSGYDPKITFIVVQKRHHTRLFPKPNEGDKNGNVLPGTVVDRGIAHPFGFDFFLNSHAGIQGTNKPAHYHVLLDENNFGADGMQMMTFWLCFLYCRCTRSVSYCPPAYYAHLAAFRGKLMVTWSDSSSESGTGDASEILRTHVALNKTMYFV